MVNTSIDVFSEKEEKKAEFLAYLTDRAPYFDASERKYLLLTREKISEYIRKANSEGDDLKALELLEAAKKSFKTPSPIEFARIISKSIRVPGDMHLKFLAQEFARHPSGEGIAVSDTPREIIMANMAIVLEGLKKLDGVNKEKLQQIVRTFELWEQGVKAKEQNEAILVKENAAVYGKTEDKMVSEGAGVEYEPYDTVFSDKYASFTCGNTRFVDAIYALILLGLRKELAQVMSTEVTDKIVLSVEVDWDTQAAFVDDPSRTQCFAANPEAINKQTFSLLFGFDGWFKIRDAAILERDIGAANFNEFCGLVEKNGTWNEDNRFLYPFDYDADLTISEDEIRFKGTPLLEENKDKICEEIVNELCASYSVPFYDAPKVNADVDKHIERGEFDKAAELKKHVLLYQQVKYLGNCLAESLIDVIKTSKVVTYTMSAGLLGLFDAYRDDLLGSIKAKKTKKETVQ